MTNTEDTCADNGRYTRCSGTGLIERESRHASPYVIMATTALVTILVSVLGWMLLDMRDVREDRELTAVAVERQKTAEARVQDLQNQIEAIRREQDIQNTMLQQSNDWRTLRMTQ